MIDNGKPVKHEGYVTDIITDLTLDWLKNRDKNKPFLMMCQHKAPHREWDPALRHLAMTGIGNTRSPRPCSMTMRTAAWQSVTRT
nr:hypothetical protein [Verrucomicrobium spinosum]